MKIIITPSADQSQERYPSPKVYVEVPSDDTDCDEAAELVGRALIAWGFHPQSVVRAFLRYADEHEDQKKEEPL